MIRKRTIQVTPEDYIATHGSLVHLLQELEKADIDAGMPTRVLCDICFSSRSEGMKLIREAENAKYIRRFKKPLSKGKKKNDRRGRYYIMNALTPLGRQLLAKLDPITRENW